MSAVTKEGVTVRVGQVWKDLDTRVLPRQCQVVTVDVVDGYAWMQNTFAPGRKPTRVKIARMHKTTTGWGLVSEMEVLP